MGKKHDRKNKPKQAIAGSGALFFEDDAKKTLDQDTKKTEVDKFLDLMVNMEKEKEKEKEIKEEKKPLPKSDISDNLLESEPGVGEVLKEFLEKSTKK